MQTEHKECFVSPNNSDHWHDTCEFSSDKTSMTEVINQLLKAQNERGIMEGSEMVFCSYLEQLRLHNSSCPVCYRGFQHPQEPLHLVSQLMGKVQGYLGTIAEKEREVEQLRERLKVMTDARVQKEVRKVKQNEEERNFSPPPDDTISCHSFTQEDTAQNLRDINLSNSHQNEEDIVPKESQPKKLIPKEPYKPVEEEATNSQPDEVQELRKSLQSLQDKISSKNQQIDQLVQEKNLLLKGRVTATYGTSESQEPDTIPDVFPPHFLSDLRDESREDASSEPQEADHLPRTPRPLAQEGQETSSYSCFICKESFNNNTYFSQHMLRKHSLSEKLLHMKAEESKPLDKENSLYNCFFCHKTFDKKKSYQQHVRRKQHKQTVLQAKAGALRSKKSTRQSSSNANVSTNTTSTIEEETSKVTSLGGDESISKASSKRNRTARVFPASSTFDGQSNDELSSTDTVSNTSSTFKTRTRAGLRNKKKKRQVKETAEKGVYKCTLCEKSFSYPSRLNLHMSSHLGIKSITCKECGKSFTRQQYLKKHCQSVHEKLKRHICETCGQGFTFKNILKVHMMTHTEIKPFVCDKCNKPFRRKSHLLLHTSSVHAKIRAFVCSQCGKQFVEKATLIAHENGHKGIRPYSCVICSKTFTSRHYLLIHEGVHSRPFKCGLCLRRFGQKTALIRHHLRHQGRKPVRKEYRRDSKSANQYKCSICFKGFPVRQRLTIHELIHSGMKPFVCGLCGKSFSQKGHLKRHDESMHQMVRPFVCTVCGKAFSQKTNLHQHEQTHNPSDEKVTCEVCHKSYSNKYQLTKHQRVHLKDNNSHIITMLP